jgi:hypothetical protein
MNAKLPTLGLALFLLIAAFARPAAEPAPSELAWPKITAQTKPWTRWWWLGGIGTEQDFSVQMEKYAQAGLGGLELTPIYGVRGAEDRFTSYLSPEWMKKFEHILQEAKRLDLGIDMATGTGWPFGGPWIEGEDAAHYLAHASYQLKGGEKLTEPVRYVQKPIVRVAGARKVAIGELKEPVATNPNLQELALDQVRFEKALPLVSLMAFPETGTAIDLTKKVGADGTLDWVAPEGNWTLYALFTGQHGKMVERAAPGGEGYALDHLSHTALSHYLARFDQAYVGHNVGGLRGYFNDSYEVDDAQGESNFTGNFLAEFERRRGYDLRTQLPALFAKDTTETASRVTSDYRETVSDLLLDEFTKPWQAWAKQHGTIIRNQAHGSPANLLDLYAASDIPEQEGRDVLAIKLASSAAHVMGKPLASSEAATWLDEHFLSTLAELRGSIDTYFLGGLNHNCYHGTAFSPPDEPWPGYNFYASVELNPANPIWNDFAAFNGYVARAQSFLQGGKPDEDVLLYYNIHDRWMERGTGVMPHFQGRDGETGSRQAGVALMEAGLGFDYISDRQLQVTSFENKAIKTTGASYAAIVVPETRFMPLATLEQLVKLVGSGATVVMQKRLPEGAPGLTNQADKFGALLALIQQNAVDDGGVKTAPVGAGRFLIGADLSAMLARTGVRGEPMAKQGLRYVRRGNQQGAYYFIANRGPGRFDGWVSLQSGGRAAAIFDPMSGRAGLAAWREAPGRLLDVYLQLEPGETRIVQLYRDVPKASKWTYWKIVGDAVALTPEWKVTFTEGGPEKPAATSITELKSWTTFGGDALKAFSGTAVYATTWARPDEKHAGWQLELGRVAESARVRLNGREIAFLLQPPFRVVIPAEQLQAQNQLEIVVTNLAANRAADLDRRGVPWKKFYNTNFPARRRENAGPDGLFSAAKWEPRESGLIGPVTLTAVEKLVP